MQDDINQEITFRKLSVFMMFMAKGNIARTAEAMKLSSVSVHRALHTLEEGVGCPLFVHKGRNLLPLQAAWTLLEYCQDVISLMNRGLEATRKVAGVGQGRLRIGTLYSLTLETVPRIIMGMKLRPARLRRSQVCVAGGGVRHLCRIPGSIPYRRLRAGDRHPGE